MPILIHLLGLVSIFFDGDNWRIHPNWLYCQYNYGGEDAEEFGSPEENMRHFIARMQSKGWTWGTPSVRPLPRCKHKEKFDPNCIKCE